MKQQGRLPFSHRAIPPKHRIRQGKGFRYRFDSFHSTAIVRRTLCFYVPRFLRTPKKGNGKADKKESAGRVGGLNCKNRKTSEYRQTYSLVFYKFYRAGTGGKARSLAASPISVSTLLQRLFSTTGGVRQAKGNTSSQSHTKCCAPTILRNSSILAFVRFRRSMLHPVKWKICSCFC